MAAYRMFCKVCLSCQATPPWIASLGGSWPSPFRPRASTERPWLPFGYRMPCAALPGIRPRR
jgi:hypothetical protein